MKNQVGNVRQLSTQAIQQLLSLIQAVANPSAPRGQTTPPPELISVEAQGDDLEVTVVPPKVGKRVTMRLHVVSATVVPVRPRRRRKQAR